MELEQTSPPMLGMCACDGELFRRVWDRVEGSGHPDCPVSTIPYNSPDILTPPAPYPVHTTTPHTSSLETSIPSHQLPVPTTEQADISNAEQTTPPATIEPTTLPAIKQTTLPASESSTTLTVVDPELPARLHSPLQTEEGNISGDDFPKEDDLPCLGSSSAPHGGQLQKYIREELDGWQLYRHLSRKVSGPHARTLAALASEKHRCARRLAAAYFLISGVHFWPTDQLETPRLTAWLGMLRDRFSTEQHQEHRYRAAACDTSDPCLRELFTELAGDCATHASVLRSLLETAM